MFIRSITPYKKLPKALTNVQTSATWADPSCCVALKKMSIIDPRKGARAREWSGRSGKTTNVHEQKKKSTSSSLRCCLLSLSPRQLVFSSLAFPTSITFSWYGYPASEITLFSLFPAHSQPLAGLMVEKKSERRRIGISKREKRFNLTLQQQQHWLSRSARKMPNHHLRTMWMCGGVVVASLYGR